MRRIYTPLFLFFLICISSVQHLKSQTFIGLQQSNFGGIHQSVLNPANIAGSKHRMYFNGLTTGFGFSNDYLKLSLPFPLMDLVTGNVPDQYKNDNGGLDFSNDWLEETVNGKSKNMNLYLQTRTPGVMFSLPKGFALGFQYKNNIVFQVNDVAEPLARLARYGIDSSKGSVTYSGPNQFQVGQTFGDNAFTVNINAYGELAFTVAKTIVDQKNYSIKAGVTPKLLLGYGTAYIKNRGLQIKAPGTDTIVFGQTDVEYGYTDQHGLSELNTVNFQALDNKLVGSGFGLDLGAAFEFKNTSGDGYLFRGGVSLLDAGRIKYTSGLKNVRITNSGGDKYFYLTPEFGDAWSDGQEEGIRYTDSVMRTLFDVDSSSSNVISRMPTTLNFQFDYNLYKIFYVGANWSQDLRGKKSVGVRRPSYLMLIPRIEHRFAELAIPVGIMNDYRNARIGVYLRVGPFFIGSDNIIGQLRSKNINGLDLYFGASFGLLKKTEDKENKS